MTKRIIVAFTAQPGRGSEGGVGWAFTQQSAVWVRNRGEHLTVVVDQRDAELLRNAIEEAGLDDFVEVRAVPVPRWLIRLQGNSRTRATYLGWVRHARREVRNLVRSDPRFKTVHQVTFASALLPNALPKNGRVRTVWGPINLRSGAVHPEGRRAPLLSVLALAAAPWLARWNARKVDLILAANGSTMSKLNGLPVAVEPPIFLGPMPIIVSGESNEPSRTFVFCGRMTNLKRPWIAIDAMRDPRLAEHSLVVLGDGPLREAMEQRVVEAGISDRVRFVGHQDRELALSTVAGARVLLHPSTTEGAPWAVGEAAALGVPAVVFSGTGTETTVALTRNGGEVVSGSGNLTLNFVEGILRVLERPAPTPSRRWQDTRIQALLPTWWGE